MGIGWWETTRLDLTWQLGPREPSPFEETAVSQWTSTPNRWPPLSSLATTPNKRRSSHSGIPHAGPPAPGWCQGQFRTTPAFQQNEILLKTTKRSAVGVCPRTFALPGAEVRAGAAVHMAWVPSAPGTKETWGLVLMQWIPLEPTNRRRFGSGVAGIESIQRLAGTGPGLCVEMAELRQVQKLVCRLRFLH